MDPSALSITDQDLEDLGIPRSKVEGVPFFAMLSDQERMWECLKRRVRGFLHIPSLPLLLGAMNGCIRVTSECRRMTRDPSNGKDWELCGGYHTEVVLKLTFLVFLKRITVGDYHEFLHRFQRYVFGPDDAASNPKVVEEFLALFPADVRKMLAGSRLILPDMGQGRGFVCLACGVILDRLGIQTPDHLPVTKVGESEPSTHHLVGLARGVTDE